MKLLTLSISILLLAGCTPNFQAGDCIQLDTERESWEKPDTDLFRVAEVGQKSYRIEWVKPDYMNKSEYRFSTKYIRSTDRIYKKVECK